jgi:hypothetical protein
MPASSCTDDQLIERADALNAQVCRAQLDFLEVLAELDRHDAWEDWGAQDMAHWVSLRYGISYCRARAVARGRPRPEGSAFDQAIVRLK